MVNFQTIECYSNRTIGQLFKVIKRLKPETECCISFLLPMTYYWLTLSLIFRGFKFMLLSIKYYLKKNDKMEKLGNVLFLFLTERERK